MNKLPRNLISIGHIASFIDDILVEMKNEEGNDELVE